MKILIFTYEILLSQGKISPRFQIFRKIFQMVMSSFHIADMF